MTPNNAPSDRFHVEVDGEPLGDCFQNEDIKARYLAVVDAYRAKGWEPRRPFGHVGIRVGSQLETRDGRTTTIAVRRCTTKEEATR